MSDQQQPVGHRYHIDPARFTSAEELRRRHHDLDALGLRATGSPEHRAYVDDLESRLKGLGLEVTAEDVPFERWVPTSWSLTSDLSGPVHVGAYVPYSGSTSAEGVTAPFSRTPGPGVIGVVEIPILPLTQGDFASLDWAGAELQLPAERDLTAPYERTWLSQDSMRVALDEWAAAGAAGVVLILDADPSEVDNAYPLYDGIIRDIPALAVDRHAGAQLLELVEQDATATLVLAAHLEPAVCRTLHTVVPGASDELVLIQSHTDGTSSLEDNGPEAIVAMAQYLVETGTTPERGLLLVLSGGHFAVHRAWGLAEFLRAHRDDLVARTAAALCVEHLGALAWETSADGYTVTGEYELGCFFASPHQGIIDTVRSALDRAEVTDSLVIRPFTADETGESLDGTGWPGDGTALWAVGHLPSANFISGPGYVVTALPTLDLIDIEAMRRQSIAFLEAALELASMTREDISRPPAGTMSS